MNSLSEHLRSLSRSSTTPQTLLDIAEDVQELEAEIARLREALKEVADGEIYPQQVARAALKAADYE